MPTPLAKFDGVNDPYSFSPRGALGGVEVWLS